MADLATEFCGLRLRNPIFASSGTFGYGLEFAGHVDFGELGGFVTKGLSVEPIAGNPAPRLTETASGMLNSIGLQNVGIKAFIADKLPNLRELDTTIFANVFGYTAEEYPAVIEQLEDTDGLAGYEINVSCPNTKCGGLQFGADPRLLAEVTSLAKKAAKRRPLMVKLSPNVTDIAAMASAAEEAGADAISLVNTLKALAIDAKTRKPRVAGGFAGLSGPAIKPVALRMVYEASQAVRIPVMGLGGIATAEDVAEFLIAGASAVQVGTASFWDPKRTGRLGRKLSKLCDHLGVVRSTDLTATLDFSST